MKDTHGGMLLLVKLQASVCIFAESKTSQWVFFTILKLCKWHLIAQRIYCDSIIAKNFQKNAYDET